MGEGCGWVVWGVRGCGWGGERRSGGLAWRKGVSGVGGRWIWGWGAVQDECS